MPRILTAGEQDELDRLISEKKHYELMSFCSILLDDTGSTENLKKGLTTFASYIKKDMSEQDIKKLIDILGNAEAMLLKFESATDRFIETGNGSRLHDMLELSKIYGRVGVMKKIKEYDPTWMSDDEFLSYIKEESLLRSLIGKDNEGFYLDGTVLEEIEKLPGQKKIFHDAIERLEKGGNRNLTKMLLLAKASDDKKAVEKYRKKIDALGDREKIDDAIERYMQDNGMRYRKKVQKGDRDPLYPIASHLFIGKDADKRRIAIKENLRLYLNFSKTDGYSDEKRFLEELDHPGIVRLLGSFEADGIEFLKLDFLEGKTLAEYIKPDNLLPAEESMRIIGELSDIIDYMHSKNVFYMDTKDKNVIYDGHNVKLVDFVMAQSIDGDLDDGTYVTSLLSTPKYVPPEMALHFRSYAKSDVFQLGILFHELLTGTHPFAVHNFRTGDAYRESEIIKYSLANVYNGRDREHDVLKENADLDTLLGEMLEKDHKKRPSPKEINCQLGKIKERYIEGKNAR